ncbi:protein-disulfide isomerase [Polymorphobacter arshaanensis]|uniref:Protein-disulfide isomerase n=1 Tax=Glacieibacterium arshaanense TaxID=2511025 RepID=A0A4Y9ETE2_9SPHN|nr:thioredoxin domain-containing protein [Polymorphobacter arshaanensis]TFU06453.1 protein-disulfide isomerase [Polymorphobacter arshaanensis]
MMTAGGANLRKSLTLVAVLALAACDNSASDAATGTKTKAAAPAAATATKDWTTVVAATPEGGFRMGNPNAPVKLLEFASLTCPHCKDFHEEAMATIKAKYIAPGKISYEYRSFVLNGPDFAAAMLARCQGPEVFFNLLNAFYANQSVWTEPFTKLTDADSKRLAALPQDQQIGALAVTGGLDGFMRTRGMPRAKFDQCLSNKASFDQLTKIRTDAVEKYKLTGTPTFVINGETQADTYNWATLQPKLQAAVK